MSARAMRDQRLLRGRVVEWVMLLLALAAMSINCLLIYRHVVGGGIAGCGGGSSCDELLNSRWSQVFWVPVPVFGLMTYVAVMVALGARRFILLGWALGLIAGAAAWFVVVQAVLLGRFCPWCMTAHGLGLGVVVLGLWRLAQEDGVTAVIWRVGKVAAWALLGIGLAQVYGPLPVTHRVDDSRGGVTAPVHERGPGRQVVFDGGKKRFNVASLPHLGPADARQVLVEYFDYGCPGCRILSGYLDTLMAKHPADVGVIVLPVPLESSCNSRMRHGGKEHAGSCELARLALAVWRARPEAFAGFHHELLGGLSPSAARVRALELVPQAELDAALKDPWIKEMISADVAEWWTVSGGAGNLPHLLVRDRRVLHGLPSGEASFIDVMERELGL